MRAIILAAGRGSRMKALTDERPKCLLEVGGKALIDWQIQALRAAGVDEIGVVTGYRRELLQSRGLVEFHNSRWASTNMVSSLECAKPWVGEGDFLVSYSDIFYGPEAVTSLIAAKADLAITYDVNWLESWKKRFADPLSDLETFQRSASGALIKIGGKPASLDEIQGQYMGLLYFSAAGWSEVARLRTSLSAQRQDAMHMTGTLQMVIEAGRTPITAIGYAGDWGELDSSDDLAAYTQAP